MSNVKERLARNLRASRRKTGLSQEAFADEVGVHRTYMSGIERGTRNPSITIIDKIAKALGVTCGDLLD
jgi:transcriptional regulator with XRE-family HTH domain